MSLARRSQSEVSKAVRAEPRGKLTKTSMTSMTLNVKI